MLFPFDCSDESTSQNLYQEDEGRPIYEESHLHNLHCKTLGFIALIKNQNELLLLVNYWSSTKSFLSTNIRFWWRQLLPLLLLQGMWSSGNMIRSQNEPSQWLSAQEHYTRIHWCIACNNVLGPGVRCCNEWNNTFQEIVHRYNQLLG